MSKSAFGLVILLVVVVAIAMYMSSYTPEQAPASNTMPAGMEQKEEEMMGGDHMMDDGAMMDNGAMMDGKTETGDKMMGGSADSGANMMGGDAGMGTNMMGGAMMAKTFKVGGENFKFNPAEIRVKKGDQVRIEFSNVGGWPHDWVIDEYNVRTPQRNVGESAVVEFKADKAGTFEYYCSVGQHRQQGMKGNLIVE